MIAGAGVLAALWVAGVISSTEPPANATSVARIDGPAGSTLIVESRRSVPLVHVAVAARTGSASDPRRREGLMSLAAELARRGAGERLREEVDAALDALGATLEVQTEPDSVRFEGHVLSRYLDDYLALLADMILRPRFDPAELARTRRELQSDLDELRNDDRALCARYFARNLYADHPYGRPPDGTRASLAAITRDEITAHFRRHFVGSNLIFAVSGDIEVDDAAGRIKRAFAGLKSGRAPKPTELRPPQAPAGWRIQLVDKPDRQQTQIMFGHPAVPASAPDYLALSIAFGSFGGQAMTSTLMDEVRAKRALAYGAYMNLTERRWRGAAIGWAAAANDKTVPTLKLVLKLYVSLMERGLTPERVDLFKQHLVGLHAAQMDAPEHRLDARVNAEIVGLPPDFVDRYPERVLAVTPAQVNAAIKKHIRARDLAITLVSTSATLKKRLTDAKIEDSAIDVVPFEAY